MSFFSASFKTFVDTCEDTFDDNFTRTFNEDPFFRNAVGHFSTTHQPPVHQKRRQATQRQLVPAPRFQVQLPANGKRYPDNVLANYVVQHFPQQVEFLRKELFRKSYDAYNKANTEDLSLYNILTEIVNTYLTDLTIARDTNWRMIFMSRDDFISLVPLFKKTVAHIN